MISQISIRSRNSGCDKTILGFTLVELLLVLVFIAISVATITPRLGNSIPAWKVRESSRSMLAAIRLAQQLAISRQEIMAFALDTKNASFTVKSTRGPANSDSTSNDFFIPRQFLGKDIKIVRLEGFEEIGGEKGLVFWPDGRTKMARVTLATSKDGEMAQWHILVKNDGSAMLQEIFGNE